MELYNQLTSIMFFCVILFLTIFDSKKLKSIITPFTVTAWPLVGISLLVNFYLIKMGFKPVTIRVQLFILLNLLIIWLIGYLCYFIFCHDKRGIILEATNHNDSFDRIARYHPILIIISWASILIVMYKVKSLLGSYGGFQYIGNPEFEKKMIVGPVAHITHLEKVCFILLAFSLKKSKYKLVTVITLIGLFIGIASIQVKYHLIWVLLMVFLFYTIQKPIRKQLKYITMAVVSIIIIMNLFWVLLTIAWGTFSLQSDGIRQYLIKNTFNYIASGPIVLDSWLSHPDVKPEWTMLIVIKNIINVIIGNPFRFDHGEFVNLSFSEVAKGVQSNTATAFGAYYIISGLTFTLFITIMLSITAYSIYYFNRWKDNNYITYLNIFMLMILLLTFFSQYFTLLSMYEMFAIYIFIVSLFHVNDYISRYTNPSQDIPLITGNSSKM